MGVRGVGRDRRGTGGRIRDAGMGEERGVAYFEVGSFGEGRKGGALG